MTSFIQNAPKVKRLKSLPYYTKNLGTPWSSLDKEHYSFYSKINGIVGFVKKKNLFFPTNILVDQ